jgi:hypothetical protein
MRPTTNDSTNPAPRLVPQLLLLAALLALGAIPSRAAAGATLTRVPSSLEVPAGNRAYLVEHAIGTQNYVCLPRTDGNGLGWTFFGPQATLFDDGLGQQLTHFLSTNPAEGVARATWQHSRDSSAVWALAIATSSDPAFVSGGAIPWLLLRVVGSQAGPNPGDRRIVKTTYIQRVSTVGGAAPAGDCTTVGAKALVPYAADYVFYRAK